MRIRSAFGSFVQCSSCKSIMVRIVHSIDQIKTQPFFDWMRVAMMSGDAFKHKICWVYECKNQSEAFRWVIAETDCFIIARAGWLDSLLQTYMPSRILLSASERRITVPSQRDTQSLSQTFTLTVPIWWNDLSNSIRAAESLPIFKKRLKHISSIFISPSILILFDLICLLFIKKTHKHLTLH